MSDRIDFLIQNLKEKETLLEKLVLLLDEERDYIVDLDTAGLEVKRESKLQLIGQLEKRKAMCKKALEDAARELKVTSPRLTCLRFSVQPRLPGVRFCSNHSEDSSN